MTGDVRERQLRAVGVMTPFEYDGARVRDAKVENPMADPGAYDRRILLATLDRALDRADEAEAIARELAKHIKTTIAVIEAAQSIAMQTGQGGLFDILQDMSNAHHEALARYDAQYPASHIPVGLVGDQMAMDEGERP